MSGIDLRIVQEPVPSVEARVPADEHDDDDRLGSDPRRERLVEVMLALSGRIDVDDDDGISAADIDAYRSDATLERLAMVGFSFGL